MHDDMTKTRVLVVDDSAFMRKVISDMIARDAAFEVVGTARDGVDALDKIEKLQPDVVTLDVEMPRKDGLETLRELMVKHPVPVVMLSSMTQAGTKATMEALALGAVDFIAKPSGAISLDIETVQDELIRKLKAAVGARIRPAYSVVPKPRPIVRKREPPQPAASMGGGAQPTIAVAIGASTGGPRALEEVVRQFPKDLPAAILVVQHMPAGFTRSMAERLNQIASIRVKEAEEGDRLTAGIAYIAPGDFHMTVSKDQVIHLEQTPPVNYVRPSVDVTMLGLPNVYSNRLIGVILTGMGKDGAAGMAKIKAEGGVTIVQDESTSTIYSMPRAVVENGDADFVLPLERIGDAVVRAVMKLKQRVGSL